MCVHFRYTDVVSCSSLFSTSTSRKGSWLFRSISIVNLRRTLTRTRRHGDSPGDREKPKKLFIPYSKGLSETIERRVRLLNIRTVFKTQTTLRQKLMTVKGKPDKHDVKGVVYSIPFECGSLYIGETGRTLKTRLMEHKWSVRNRDTNNGIAVHVTETDHSVQWEQAAVIKTEEFITKRKVQEALTIRRTDNNMNLDPGLMLDRIWF